MIEWIESENKNYFTLSEVSEIQILYRNVTFRHIDVVFIKDVLNWGIEGVSRILHKTKQMSEHGRDSI